MDRYYITMHATPDGPAIDLVKGSMQRLVVLAELANPQPPGLPEGMVAIVLPPNCYIDTSEVD